jgi:hypothetical protein
LILSLDVLSQNDAQSILQRCISVHDPNDRYLKFKAQIDMSIRRDKAADRYFTLTLDRTNNVFSYEVKNDTLHFIQSIKKGRHHRSYNGNKNPSLQTIKKYDLTPERTQNLKEVYEYLMLLPMRLKEDLSYLSKSYTEEKFNEKPCYKLTFSYPPVGENETWYFFISKEDFRLEGYQFFQKDILSDGEFIYLSDYKWIKGLLVPKVKKWYWNKDGSFFRTDTILATR